LNGFEDAVIFVHVVDAVDAPWKIRHDAVRMFQTITLGWLTTILAFNARHGLYLLFSEQMD
jgi:hypothetical protein